MYTLNDRFSGRLTYLIYQNRVFFIVFSLIWVAVSLLQSFFSQREIILTLNSLHTPALDKLFWLTTALGNGFFVMAAGLAVFFFSRRQAGVIVAGYLLSGAVVQLVKRFVLPDIHRPVKALADISHGLHKVEGVEFFSNGSFPSGHTASAFALFAALAFISRAWPVKLVCLLLACLAGYSRIYLLQHFLRDVHAGALLGVLAALVSQVIFDRLQNQPK